MSKTNVPSIPLPRAENLLDVAKAVKGILDVREGFIGDPLDQNVTFRDLVDAGAVAVRPNWNTTSGLTPVIPTWANPDGYDPVADLTTPDKPLNFTVTSMFSAVQLKWDLPAQRNFAYAEIWRSDTNVIGNAVLLGTSDTQYYVDQLGTSSTKYYWIRFVNQANIKGPYNATSGTAGTASDDPAYVIGVLSDAYGSTSLAPFFQLDAPTTINGVSIAAGTYIKSAFIADATITNAKIKDAAVDNAKIANLDAAKITSGFISANRIQAGSLDAKIANIDAAVITSGTIGAARIGDLDASKITTGRLSSARIDGANLTVTGGGFTGYAWPASGQTGFYLGSSGLLLGNANDGKYLQVTADGNIYTPGFNVVAGAMTINSANAVSTLNIAGNAVTVFSRESRYSYSASNSTYTETFYLNTTASGTFTVMASLFPIGSFPSGAQVSVTLSPGSGQYGTGALAGAPKTLFGDGWVDAGFTRTITVTIVISGVDLVGSQRGYELSLVTFTRFR
jgi:hypothetical protein